MGSVIVCIHICKKISTKFIQSVKIPDIQRGHPLVFHGTEPPFNFCFLGWRIRLVIMEDGTNSCGKQLHLFVAVGFSVIKVEYLRTTILRNG